MNRGTPIANFASMEDENDEIIVEEYEESPRISANPFAERREIMKPVLV